MKEWKRNGSLNKRYEVRAGNKDLKDGQEGQRIGGQADDPWMSGNKGNLTR